MAYPSLTSQLCIGGVYVRLLLEGGDPSESQWSLPPRQYCGKVIWQRGDDGTMPVHGNSSMVLAATHDTCCEQPYCFDVSLRRVCLGGPTSSATPPQEQAQIVSRLVAVHGL